LINQLLDGVKLSRKKPKTEPPLPTLSPSAVGIEDMLTSAENLKSKPQEVGKQQVIELDKKVNQDGIFQGKQRKKIMLQLVSKWLPTGPAVAILQGFPGSGKSQMALEVAANSQRCIDPFEPQLESPTPSLDLLTDIALALESEGIYDLMQELEKGSNGDLYQALLRVLRRERILIILDEFQRLFPKANTLPPKSWQFLVEKLNNSNRPAGRLLLISNRSIKSARWCENCITKELSGLTATEAATFLFELLKSKNLSSKVPDNRLEEIGIRLEGDGVRPDKWVREEEIGSDTIAFIKKGTQQIY